jgi:ATP-binding cassette subfamily B multidrug efflux pump
MTFFSNIRSLGSLNKYLWRYKTQLLLGILFVIISNFFGVVPAQIMRYALNLVLKNVTEFKAAKDVAAHAALSHALAIALIKYAAVIIGMALLRGVFMFMMRQTIIVMSRKIEYDLKNDIYEHFQKLSMSYYRRNNTGDMLARITEDVGRVRMYLGPAIMYAINLTTLIFLVVSIMLSVNARLTFYVLLPLPILAIAMYYVNDITYKRGTYFQEQLSRLTTFVQETFSGIRVIKSFAAEKSVHGHFDDEVELYKNKALYLAGVDALYFPVIAFLIGMSTLITLYVGGQEVMKGTMSPGNIAEFFMYVNALAWPVASIGWTTNLIQRAAASQTRINEIMNIRPDIEWKTTMPPVANNPKNELAGEIELKNITLVYPDTNIKALDNISLHIRPGESLGVIGHTGSGKSTLAYLLLRLYDVSSGEIRIDEKDIKFIDLGQYRANVGYVPQDDFLFSESLENNILWGVRKKKILNGESGNKTHIDVENAATVADVHKDILGFPAGYETMLGERGITLSGGQKQRVAIARAIAGSPKILILDDCFSAIDTNTEAQILQNLSSVMKGKTSVLISHRVSTVKNCNHIIVLQDGRIIEEGRHPELIENKGYYYTLYRKQLMEKELYEQQKVNA